MTAHTHAVYVEGCHRCDLSRDEVVVCTEHDWLDGECQACGVIHPEDCVLCPGQPGAHDYTPPERDNEEGNR